MAILAALVLFCILILNLAEKGDRFGPGLRPGKSRTSSFHSEIRESKTAGESSGRAKIAIIIDDLGPNLSDFHAIRGLHPNLSFAVLPFQSHSIQIAREARMNGNHDLLLHLPLEANRKEENPGSGAIYHSMGSDEIIRQVRRDLQAIPDIQGVNNHMGSRITSDPAEMTIILSEIKSKNLFFVDSRTAASSVAFSLAEKLGIRSGKREVFLDDSASDADIQAEFRRLEELARRNGSAIAIGHPRPATIRALKTFITGIDRENLELVPVSELLR
jgi:hypothetical protein